MNIGQVFLAIRKRLFLLFGKRYIIKKIRGRLFLLDMWNYIDRQIEAFGVYESDQIKVFQGLLQENDCDVFVDIGAHWGYYCILIASEPCFSNTKVFAFEPDPVNRSQLFGNIFLNRLQDKIEVHSVGLSDKDGSATFNCHEDENRGRSKISDEGELVINVRTLDSLLSISDQNIGLKIDVEGHEISVIQGMRKMLKHNNCVLQIESFGSNSRILRDLLLSYGYNQLKKIGNDYYYSNIGLNR